MAFFLTICFTAAAQQNIEKYSIKGKKMLAVATTLKSTRYLQGNNDIYKELSFDYGLGNFISSGLYLGHQERHYSFVSLGSSGSHVYYYDQIFVTMGLRATMHISPFIHNHLGVNVNPEKWDVYIRYYAGLAINNIDEKFNRYNSHLTEHQIDYSLYREDEDMNYSAGILTGIQFYPLKNLGLFFEGGYGPMGNFNLGLVAKY